MILVGNPDARKRARVPRPSTEADDASSLLSSESRETLATITDPVELEAARVASSFTSVPSAIEVGEIEVDVDDIGDAYADDEAPTTPATTSSSPPRGGYHVIAEGDDAVGEHLTLDEALALAASARQHGKRYVAVVDDATDTLVDEPTSHR